MSEEPKPQKTSSVRHTRAIKRDRSKRPSGIAPDEEVQARMEELIHPLLYTQQKIYEQMGLRQRILNLPLMMAFVHSLIWRQIGSVSEVVRELNRRGMLWSGPKQVTQQALSQRFSSFPADLFYQVLMDLLPFLQQRWRERKRPKSKALA